jgi:phage terminase large subunit-like protein
MNKSASKVIPNDVASATTYAEQIVSGAIPSNKYLKLSCEKFLREKQDTSYDLSDDVRLSDKSSSPSPYRYEEARVQFVLDWFKVCPHTKGELAGKPLILSPWQIFIIANIYGFIHKETGYRKHKNILIEVGRKNGKSTLLSGLLSFELLTGGEGSLLVSAATMSAQAKLVWEDTKRMTSKLPSKLKEQYRSTVSEISVPSKFSKYIYVGRNSDRLDGLNPNMVVVDEAAAIEDRNLIEVLTSATGARPNYLFIYITTSSFSKDTAYYEQYEYAKRILDGAVEDPEFFSAIYELDEDDNPLEDETCWIKANPNLNVSLGEEYLRSQVNQAVEIPAKRNNVLVKHFNRWESSTSTWLPTDLWKQSVVPEINKTGELFVGVDLGQTSDLTALTFIYRHNEDGEIHYDVDFKCFIPERTFDALPRSLKPIYNRGVQEKILYITEGSATDLEYVKEILLEEVSDKNLNAICWDSWNAQMLLQQLEKEGLPLLTIGQGYGYLSAPTKSLEIAIRNNQVKHTNSSFIEWQFNNCEIYSDNNENIKISKKSNTHSKKVDSLVALVMGFSQAEQEPEEQHNYSYFL